MYLLGLLCYRWFFWGFAFYLCLFDYCFGVACLTGFVGLTCYFELMHGVFLFVGFVRWSWVGLFGVWLVALAGWCFEAGWLLVVFGVWLVGFGIGSVKLLGLLDGLKLLCVLLGCRLIRLLWDRCFGDGDWSFCVGITLLVWLIVFTLGVGVVGALFA